MLIFILDPDVQYAKRLQFLLARNADYRVVCFKTLALLRKKLYEQPDLLITDYYCDSQTALSFVPMLQEKLPNTGMVILSDITDIKMVIKLHALKLVGYFYKEQNVEREIWDFLSDYYRKHIQKRLHNSAVSRTTKLTKEHLIKGNSRVIKELYKLISKAAQTSISVSINGETGSGKELVAQSIHYESPRRDGQFVALNLAAIPKGLLEAELFGHEKGAFTNAHERRIGRIEQAHGGTLFLDEIGEMPLDMQVKLLRVLQENKFNRVGGNQDISSDFRVITATHCNLLDEVEKGRFRQDLFYRIIGLPITVAPLRDRKKDIPLLANYFLDEFSRSYNSDIMEFSPESLLFLMSYDFPGNVRELRSIVETAAVNSDSNTIKVENIQFTYHRSKFELLGDEMSLKDYNHRIIQFYLNKYSGDVKRTAEVLKIGKSTIYNELKRMKEQSV